jgi:hypothetical protein
VSSPLELALTDHDDARNVERDAARDHRVSRSEIECACRIVLAAGIVHERLRGPVEAQRNGNERYERRQKPYCCYCS